MNKFLFSMFAVATGLVALAEPCVLEKGYKPFAKQSVDEVASLLGELSLETPAEPQAVTPAPQAEPIVPQVEQPQVVTPEPQAAETAAGKMPAPPVKAAPSVTPAPPVKAAPSVTPAPPVEAVVTGKAGILPATATAASDEDDFFIDDTPDEFDDEDDEDIDEEEEEDEDDE